MPAGKAVVAFPHAMDVSARFMHSFVGLLIHDGRNNRRIVDGGGYMPTHSGANITNARNEIVRAFLDQHDAEWLWWIDTDHEFDPDTLDRLVDAADAKDRPIVGGLCFKWNGRTRSASPTLYGFDSDQDKIVQYLDYPADTLVPAMTGTGCLVVHRSVLAAMRDKFPAPYEWFREEAYNGQPVGEDITFMLRAMTLGYKPHVHTGITTGHEKHLMVDESYFRSMQVFEQLLAVAQADAA